ncbi:MAG: hypothetical protein U0586_07590 [Candidatus Brocadiaceae bacterium]
MISLKHTLLKTMSFVYRNFIPRDIQKIMYPLVCFIYSFVHRIYSICLDVYPTVSLLKEGGSQNNVSPSFLVAGRRRDSAFLLNKIYREEPEATRLGRMLVWKIPFLDKSPINATLIEADRCFSPFFARRGFFAIPEWVLFTMDISMPIEKVTRLCMSNRNNFRKIRKYSYQYEVGFDKEKLHLFYHTMYLPYICSRHGKLTVLTTLNQMEDLLQKGELLLVKRGDKYVAGQLIYKASPVPIVSYLGVKDGNFDLVKQGAVFALYYYTILWAKEKGYTKLDFGHCRSFLNDGIFLFKKRLGMRVQRSPRKHRILYLSVKSINPYLEQFFANNPLVHEDQGVLKGLLFVQKDDPSIKEAVETSSRKYSIPGLAGFTVVLPDGTTIETSKP